MSLPDEVIVALADRVEAAQRDATELTKLTDDHPGMSVDDGYRVLAELERRWAVAGRRLAGFKAGLTSKAKMVQMGVDRPGFGLLYADTAVAANSSIDVSTLIHPKVEPEIAVVTSSELTGSVTVAEVLAAVDFVVPAIEVLDSRYKDFRFDLPSVIADNSSSARYATGNQGRRTRGADIDLAHLGVVLEINGKPVATAAGAAVLGDPLLAVVEVVAWLGRQGRSLPAGSLVLTGGATEAFAVVAGDVVTARVQHLGSVSIIFC